MKDSRINVVLTLILWVITGYFGYGLTLGDFDHQFPWSDNRGIASFIAVTGPVGLGIMLIITGPPHHFRMTAPTVEERWQAFHAQWPRVSRGHFERQYN